MKIPTSKAIMPLNKNNAYLVTTPEGGNYFPPVLVREKGETIELAVYENDDIPENKKLTLSDVLYGDNLSSKFYVKVSDLDKIFGTESEEVIPKLITLFDQFHRINSELILQLITKLQDKYSVEDIILQLEVFEEDTIRSLVYSDEAITMYEELQHNYDDYSEDSQDEIELDKYLNDSDDESDEGED